MTAQPVPDFLIVGAMKAGTTTLYRDLHGHPQVFLPEEKEPDTLTRYGDDDDAMHRDYAKLFRPAPPGTRLGEASTSYTKRPEFEGVAQRALRICGPALKVIYLEREPIERALSHYRHEYGLGFFDTPLAEALDQDNRFADFSSYEWQIEPWIEALGKANVLRIDFATYTRDRAATLEMVAGFLGIDAAAMPSPDGDTAFNRSADKPVVTGAWQHLVLSDTYQKVVKPLIPWRLRGLAARLVLSRARQTDETLPPELERDLRARIARRNASAGSPADEVAHGR